MTAIAPTEERLLTFEVGGTLYALPIAGIREVAEVGRAACIPTVPATLAGVINHHGDALPVFRRQPLLGLGPEPLPPPQHVLVLSDPVSGAARFGLPVDRVLGLVDGPPVEGVEERGDVSLLEGRSIEGSVATVIDPRRLVARAQEMIESTLARRD